ncbi:hypothetical protein CRG98_022670, partial [Punica granatum]
MDNYGSSQYPYHNPYGYPPHPPNHPYPPPNPYAYGTPAYGYPPHYPPPSHTASHSGPIDYHHSPPPQPPATSHSGPIDYHHHYHQPSPYPYPYPASPHQQSNLQHQGSFQYGSSHHHHESHTDAPSQTDSSRVDAAPANDNGYESSASQPSIYPPLDDMMNNMRISDHQVAAPASPSAPSITPLHSSPPSARFSNSQSLGPIPGHFYGYPNDSFSGNWEENYKVPEGAHGQPAYAHSSSFGGSSNHNSQNTQIVQIGPSKGSLKVLLLHGNLDIWVYEAKNLPNMDMFHKTLGDMFGRLPNTKITSDPYVSVSISNAVIGQTYVISNSENPVWRQHFHVPVAHYAAEVLFLIKDSDVVGSQLMGTIAIPVEQLYTGAKIEGTYPILTGSGKPCKPGAVLTLSIQYIPIEKLSIYHHGVGAGPDYYGVPGTYFPLRKGGSVTLYQDAHVPDGFLPNITLENGMYYAHGKCWHEIFNAIRQARRLIYITGWSVWHKVRLVRDGSLGSDCTLGELLRSKSQEGVRVLLLVWDDPTSRSILGYQT